MKRTWPVLLILFAALIQQCAKQTAPTGGPKDETAPTLVRSTPTHEQVNVTSTEIQLTFDELIQLNNPREQLIITPIVGKKFEATARKNKVTLKLNAELQPNTTYNINFRECIQDLTEKNPARVKIAFSTGEYIDTLAVTGRVRDVLTDKDLANYTVALAEASDTFNLFKHPATWIALTDKQGKYSLENLKQGHYILYAFDDKNKNLIVDGKSEKYAFKSEPIALDKNSDSIRLNSFKLDITPLRLISSRPTFSYYNIRLSKSITNYTLTPTIDSLHLYSILDTDLSTIKVYNSIGTFDSLQMRLQAMDSLESKVDTLIYLKFSQRESTKDKLTAKIDYVNVYQDRSQFVASVSFSKPMTHITPDSIYVQLDSLTRLNFSPEDFTWNPAFTQVTFTKKIELPKEELPAKRTERIPASKSEVQKEADEKPKAINELIVSSKSLISVENDSVPKLTSPFKIIKPTDTGVILVKIETSEQFIIQLLDKNKKVLEEIKNIQEHKFANLPPGLYQLRLIVDQNKNGKWDPGYYHKKTEPEPIIFYQNIKGVADINLKANWEVGPLLITY